MSHPQSNDAKEVSRAAIISWHLQDQADRDVFFLFLSLPKPKPGNWSWCFIFDFHQKPGGKLNEMEPGVYSSQPKHKCHWVQFAQVTPQQSNTLQTMPTSAYCIDAVRSIRNIRTAHHAKPKCMIWDTKSWTCSTCWCTGHLGALAMWVSQTTPWMLSAGHKDATRGSWHATRNKDATRSKGHRY